MKKKVTMSFDKQAVDDLIEALSHYIADLEGDYLGEEDVFERLLKLKKRFIKRKYVISKN